MIEADHATGRLRYSRVSPGRRAGTVEVRIEPAGPRSRIHVAYDMTALGRAGEPAVTGMTESGFAAMLGEWKRLIDAALGSQAVPVLHGA